MDNLDLIFTEAQKCSKCKSIPSIETYKKYGIPYPVPWYVKNFHEETVKIMFILESAGTAEGGAAQTGKLSDSVSFDQTAKNARYLRVKGKINDEDCFFINSILHAAIDNDGEMRKPFDSEINQCSHFVKRIIDTLDPLIVAPVGNAALKSLNYIEPHHYKRITSCAGKEFLWYNRITFPLVHWSRRGLANRKLESQIEDFIRLRKVLDKMIYQH